MVNAVVPPATVLKRHTVWRRLPTKCEKPLLAVDCGLSFCPCRVFVIVPLAVYLFIFAGGLLGTLILVMIMYMAGVNSYICLFIGAGGASLIVWQTFSLNRKYGEHGLMKIAANKRHPRYIICRKPVHRYLKFTPKQNAV